MTGTEKESYRHGGIPRLDMKRLGLPERQVLDFSVSLNPLGPPQILRDRWSDLFSGIEGYPTPEGDGVSYFYHKKFHFSPDCFMAGSGSTEMIYLLPRTFLLNRIVIATPSYNDYARACLLAGVKVLSCPFFPDEGFTASRDRVMGALRRADALWLGSPNNPTGVLFPAELTQELAEAYPNKWIIADEAFMPFVEDWTGLGGIRSPSRDNILVIHSLTKFYALAGLRIGGVAGPEAAISRLREVREPWTVNGVAERVAPLLLECGDYEEQTRLMVRRERRRLIEAFEGMEGITPYPSVANFILCRWHLTGNLDDLLRHLLSRGIYVRDCRNFPGLEDNYFRTAVRTPQENDLLISGILSFNGEIHA